MQAAVATIRTRLENVERWFMELDEALLAHSDPEHDERAISDEIRDIAALCIELIRLDPASSRLPELEIICINVETFAPPRLAIPIGSRLWMLLTRYYLDQIEQVREQLRAAAIYALLSLLITQLMVSESS